LCTFNTKTIADGFQLWNKEFIKATEIV